MYSFSAQPENGLIYRPDGSFYVLYGFGGVIQLFPPAQPDVGWSGVELLPSPEESRVWVSVGPNGELFDATQYGGRAKRGSVDELVPPRAPGGTWTTKVIFGCCGKAANDPNTLTAVSDGTLYGTTYGSNPPISYGAGAAFSLTPPQSSGQEWTYTLLADFGAKHPNTPLVLHNGNLYGAFTRVNGDGGAVFEMQPPTAPGRAWTTTYLHHFTNGQHPFGQLIVDKDGTIFGMTASDPTQPQSVTIFKIAPGGN